MEWGNFNDAIKRKCSKLAWHKTIGVLDKANTQKSWRSGSLMMDIVTYYRKCVMLNTLNVRKTNATYKIKPKHREACSRKYNGRIGVAERWLWSSISCFVIFRYSAREVKSALWNIYSSSEVKNGYLLWAKVGFRKSISCYSTQRLKVDCNTACITVKALSMSW